jgi:hypothetical protein
MEWSVAIFSSRETIQTLMSTIDAVLKAANDVATVVDVMINGNRGLADEAGRRIETLQPVGRPQKLIRVWHIQVGDKAHAWNQYVHDILPPSDVAFFVDGYAQVMPDALKLISDGFKDAPKAFAASGVPTIGRSAGTQTEIMLREGGIHGSLYAVRGDFVGQLRSINFRLPLGIYRTDPVLGAAICFTLDPARNDWESARIFVHPRATWKIRPLSFLSLADVRSHFKKIMRQAQGALENLAVRQHLAIEKKTPQSLPRTSAELIEAWIAANPAMAFKAMLKNPLCLIAARRIRRVRDWSEASVPARLVAQVTLE